ncbi:nuclear transport factor 2 family protein [Sphingobacterium sp.]|uniref:nuclear transport factor 2 family protein n=1 Tax=Sphingobacterium sp. TaxID=341027 RepID=UPI00289CD955|nr:nuclear transport factor 2 family protein [Sphingobacterium sp.]
MNTVNMTVQTVEAFYNNLANKDYQANINLFADTVEWRIPGNDKVATWIKDRNSKTEIQDFYRELYENLEGVSFDITGKYYDGNKAVVTGHLVSRILRTGKLFDSYFSVEFTVENGLITKYLMLENSYALIESLKHDEVDDENFARINKISLPKQTHNKNVAEAYFRKVDAGEFDNSYYNLFTEDVELYFPKFGFGYGKDGVKKFGETMARFLGSITHDIKNFNYIISGNMLVVEGTERGITIEKKLFPDNVTAFGKFCSVFEFEGDLIKRMHIYVDPDVTSSDIDRLTIFNDKYQDANAASQTKDVVYTFFDILSGKSNEKIVNLFADEVDWDMPGNTERFTWLGKRSTKDECANFFEEHPKMVEQEKFEIDFISFNGENAVAVGNLSAKILKYNKNYSSSFSAIFKVKNGRIIKYYFMEDSHKLNEITCYG